jgi:hypothetical protein
MSPVKRTINVDAILRRRGWLRITTINMPVTGIPDLLMPVKVYTLRVRRLSVSWRGKMPPIPETFKAPPGVDEFLSEPLRDGVRRSRPLRDNKGEETA